MFWILSDKQITKSLFGIRETRGALIVKRNGAYEFRSTWVYEYFPLAAERSLFSVVQELREKGAEFRLFESPSAEFSYAKQVRLDPTNGANLLFWTENYGIGVVLGYHYSNNGEALRFILGGVSDEAEAEKDEATEQLTK